MNPAAKKCIQWAIGLWVVGAVLVVYMPDIYMAIADRAGTNAEAGLEVVNVALTLAHATLMPLGAALVGAAVVIQVMVGGANRAAQGSHHDRNRNS